VVSLHTCFTCVQLSVTNFNKMPTHYRPACRREGCHGTQRRMPRYTEKDATVHIVNQRLTIRKRRLVQNIKNISLSECYHTAEEKLLTVDKFLFTNFHKIENWNEYQRCQTVMRTFKWNVHTLICSEHFVKFRSATIPHTNIVCISTYVTLI